MYHPYIISYVKDYHGKNENSVLWEVIDALQSPEKILNLDWVSLSTAIFKTVYKTPVFRCVYRNGWDYNDETKNLRKVFEQMVIYKNLDKKLESYL